MDHIYELENGIFSGKLGDIQIQKRPKCQRIKCEIGSDIMK